MNDADKIRQYVDETDWTIIDEVDPYVYVLGLDPGGTTGVAMLRIDTRDDEINPELIYLHQIPGGLHGFVDWFYGTRPQYNLITVSEKWKERNRKGADRTPQYIEGAMHAMWDDANINYQYPEVKEQVPDEWLKENNLWTEGHRHQMDALKHALAYLRNNGHSATIKGLSGVTEGAMGEEGAGEAAQLDEGQDAMDALHEAMAKAVAAMEAFQEAVGEATDGQPIGPGGNFEKPKGADEYVHKEDTRKRGRKELNGAFAGFAPAEEDEGGTSLFED